jgi:hypothetical protein
LIRSYPAVDIGKRLDPTDPGAGLGCGSISLGRFACRPGDIRSMLASATRRDEIGTQMTSNIRSFTTVVSGLFAAATGMLAMDGLAHWRYRRDGGDHGFVAWEFSTGAHSFDDVGAPGHIGKMIATAAHIDNADSHVACTSSVVHWATGAAWGLSVAVIVAATGAAAPPVGVADGLAAFATSYAVLAPLGIYQPIWTYDINTLWNDFSGHLTFGLATGTTRAALHALARTVGNTAP